MVLPIHIHRGDEEANFVKASTLLLLALVLLPTGCAAPDIVDAPGQVAGQPSPDESATASQAGSSSPTTTWRQYTNAQVGFGVQYPPDWQVENLPDENSGQLHQVAISGPEGGLVLAWGTGVGGACPEGHQPLTVAQGTWPACHSQKGDGTDLWSLAGRTVGDIAVAGYAYTSDTSSDSREIVLHVVSTLSLP